MIEFMVVLATAVAVGIVAVSWRRDQSVRAVFTPLVYVVLLWIVAFPVRAWLISRDLVDTQVIATWSDGQLAGALLVATVMMVAVGVGAMSVRSWRNIAAVAPSIPSGGEGRVLLAAAGTALVSILVFAVLSFENGAFLDFQQNALIERRVGRGVIALLAELGSLGLVCFLAHVLARENLRRPWKLVAVGALHVAAAAAMMVGLTTRRPVALLMIGAVAVVFVRSSRLRRQRALVLVVLAATAIVAPLLNTLRYTCIPCLFDVAVTQVAPESDSQVALVDEVRDGLLLLLQEADAELSDEQIRTTRSLRSRFDEASILRDGAEGLDQRRSSFAESVVADHLDGELSASQEDLVAIFERPLPVDDVGVQEDAVTTSPAEEEEEELPSPPAAPTARQQATRAFLTAMSSSFEGVDHTATFLDTATPVQLATGVDHGQAWLYNVALSVVPRAVWSGKPEIYGSVAEQAFLYPYMFQETGANTTLPVSFVVDFMFGFGALVGLVLAFFLGRFLEITGRDLHERSASTPSRTLALFVMLNAFNVVRGGTSFAQGMLLLAVVMVAFHGWHASATASAWLLRQTFEVRRPAAVEPDAVTEEAEEVLL